MCGFRRASTTASASRCPAKVRRDRGGPPGDLYIYVTVRPHELFHREGTTLYCEVPITFTQAALGRRSKYRLWTARRQRCGFRKEPRRERPSGCGLGVPHLRGGGRGDQIVRVRVVTPTKLTPKQREALVQLAKAAGEDPPEVRNFFERVRDAFGGRNG